MNRKLSLNKEVIATLNNDSMNQVRGGEAQHTYGYDVGCSSAIVMAGDSRCVCKVYADSACDVVTCHNEV